MSRHPVQFDGVTKSFVMGENHDSLRDVLARLATFGRGGKKKELFNALSDISFHVAEGEAVGIIGPNGSGKSTTLKLVTGIYIPTSGRVHVGGRVAPLIEVGAGFHPDLTGRENIYLNGSISGMSRAEIDELFDQIVEFSGLEKFLETPVKRYSSGMYMRLGFSIAAHIPSEILVVDEVLAVGDIGFRARCIERMQELKRAGRTIMFVSHSPFQVRSLCDRVVYIVEGKVEFDGDPVEGTRRYEQDLLSGRVGQRQQGTAADRGAVAALRQATILEQASDQGIVLQTGAPLSVKVSYQLDEDHANAPVLSIGLLRGDGVMACVLNSRELGHELPGGEGVHDVVGRLADLPLFPGKYSVEVLLWDAEMVVVLDQLTAGAVVFRKEQGGTMNRPGVFLPDGGFHPAEA